MLRGILSSYFLQAAGRAGKTKKNVFTFTATSADPTIPAVSCDGSIVVTSTKNGVVKKETYTDLSMVALSVEADALSEIKITGNLSVFGVQYGGSSYGGLASVHPEECASLLILDINSNNTITEINISQNTLLESFDGHNCGAIKTIYALAQNETVAQGVAGMITTSAVDTGTVYVNSTDPYYSVIDTAAQMSSWTISPLLS